MSTQTIDLPSPEHELLIAPNQINGRLTIGRNGGRDAVISIGNRNNSDASAVTEVEGSKVSLDAYHNIDIGKNSNSPIGIGTIASRSASVVLGSTNGSMQLKMQGAATLLDGRTNLEIGNSSDSIINIGTVDTRVNNINIGDKDQPSHTNISGQVVHIDCPNTVNIGGSYNPWILIGNSGGGRTNPIKIGDDISNHSTLLQGETVDVIGRADMKIGTTTSPSLQLAGYQMIPQFGNFTPQITGGGPGLGLSTSQSDGTYVTYGPVVNFDIIIIVTGANGRSGPVDIYNMPFLGIDSGFGGVQSVMVVGRKRWCQQAVDDDIYCVMDYASTGLRIVRNAVQVQVSDIDFVDGGTGVNRIRISGTYMRALP